MAAPLTSTPPLTLTRDGSHQWSVWAIDRGGMCLPPGGRRVSWLTQRRQAGRRCGAGGMCVLTRTGAITLSWSRVAQAVRYTVHMTGSVYRTYNVPDAGANPVISPTVMADGVYTWAVEALDTFSRS